MHTKKPSLLLRFIDAILAALYKFKSKLEAAQSTIQSELDARLDMSQQLQQKLPMKAKRPPKSLPLSRRKTYKLWQITGYNGMIKAMKPGEIIKIKKPRFASPGDFRRYAYNTAARHFGSNNFTIAANASKTMLAIERVA